MISLVNGVVRSISLDKVIVEVGGVGLSLAVTQKTSAQLNIGVQVQLFTTLVVREDALTLYGFLEDGDRALFEFRTRRGKLWGGLFYPLPQRGPPLLWQAR